MQKMQIWSRGQEDSLEKEMATHSSILDWEIPWTEEPGWLESVGSQRVDYDWACTQACDSKACFPLYLCLVYVLRSSFVTGWKYIRYKKWLARRRRGRGRNHISQVSKLSLTPNTTFITSDNRYCRNTWHKSYKFSKIPRRIFSKSFHLRKIFT